MIQSRARGGGGCQAHTIPRGVEPKLLFMSLPAGNTHTLKTLHTQNIHITHTHTQKNTQNKKNKQTNKHQNTKKKKQTQNIQSNAHTHTQNTLHTQNIYTNAHTYTFKTHTLTHSKHTHNQKEE